MVGGNVHSILLLFIWFMLNDKKKALNPASSKV